MFRLLFLYSLMLPLQLNANTVFHSTDKYGRTLFSDQPTADGRHEIITIDIQNDYDWHNPKLKLKKSYKKKTKKKRRKKKKKTYSFAELQGKCTKARYRYQNYRGTVNNSDWGSYKEKISRYAQKREHWCSRALKRK